MAQSTFKVICGADYQLHINVSTSYQMVLP